MHKGAVIFFFAGIFLCLNANADIVPHDPTQPTLPSSSLESDSGQGGMQLDGILYSTTRPIAIIGGNVVHVDNMIEDYKVTEIHRNSVVLTSSKGEILTLKMMLPNIKQPHI